MDGEFGARCRRVVGLSVAMLCALGTVFAGVGAAGAVAPSSVTDVGICFGFAGSGGCQAGFGGTTTGTSGATPSQFSAALVATSGLSQFDSIIIDASSGAPGTQFGTGGYQVDNETTQVGCAVFTPVDVENSGQTVSVQIPDGCEASPGDEMVVQLSGSETNPDTAGPITMQLSTTRDVDPVTTNALQLNSTVPGRPTDPTATAGDQTVTVGWTPPARTGGAAITEYDVYCSSSSPPDTSGAPSATAAGNAVAATVSGLTNGVAQHCVVTAVNTNGASAASDEVSATPTNLPGAPVFPDAEPANHAADVSWGRPQPRGPLPITGYHVYCSTTNPPTVDPSDLCATAGGGRRHTVHGLVPGTEYFFVVTALNANGEGPASDVVSTTPGEPPSRPWAVRAIPHTRSIVVRWKPSKSSGYGPLVAYGVFCSTTGPPPIDDSTLVGTTLANVLKVNHLTTGTTYYCRVAAANAYGVSKGSPVVTAVPL